MYDSNFECLFSYHKKISENYIYIIHFFVVPHITLGKVYKGGQNGKKDIVL